MLCGYGLVKFFFFFQAIFVEKSFLLLSENLVLGSWTFAVWVEDFN